MKLAWISILFVARSVLAQQGAAPFYTEAYRQQGNQPLCIEAQPAALAFLTKPAFALYAERKYLVPGLNAVQLALAKPLRKGTIGGSGHYLGLAGFRQWALQLSYGRVLGQQLCVGVGLEAGSVQAGLGPAAITLSPNLGMMVRLNESFTCGVRLSRFWQASLTGKETENTSPVYAFGCGWALGQQCFIGAELGRTAQGGAGLHAQLSYGFTPRLQAALGMITSINSPWLSLGYGQGSWSITVLNSFHPLLGLSPGLLLRYAPSRS